MIVSKKRKKRRRKDSLVSLETFRPVRLIPGSLRMKAIDQVRLWALKTPSSTL